MYIDRARIENVKCFADVPLRFRAAAQTGDPQSNWNVILGENGDGKSTLLQAIAACLMDATTADRLLKPAHWIRRGVEAAALGVTLVREEGDNKDGRPEKNERSERMVQYCILGPGDGSKGAGRPRWPYHATAALIEPSPEYNALFAKSEYERLASDIDFLKRNAFARKNNRGWFSAGYGPFRRLSGFSSNTALVDDPLEKRFLTLFDEGAALFDCESWLKELDRKATKSRMGSPQRAVLEECKQILVNLLPEIDEITIEDEVLFQWRGASTGLTQLSDGYRSMFALAVDILRWLEQARADRDVPLNQGRGVVLIDEIDTHLHPKWQREAGFLLCKIFPNLQFIVTSHSPFVAMAAGDGCLTLLERDGDVVRATQDLPYVRGWAVDEVLSQLFGLVSVRDPETEAKLARYDELRIARRGRALSKDEDEELAKLERYLNERLRGEDDSPKSKQMDEDMAFFARAAKEREGKGDAQG